MEQSKHCFYSFIQNKIPRSFQTSFLVRINLKEFDFSKLKIADL